MITFLGVFPWFLLALWSEHLCFCTSLISYSLLVIAQNSKAEVCKISKWELSRWPKFTKHHYANTKLYFYYKCKTLDSKIQHFRRWVEFVMVWEIWILNLEGRLRCISFVFIGYETMTVIQARACAKLWKCPFKIKVQLCYLDLFPVPPESSR